MLKAQIKNKIKQLLDEKKVNKAELSRSFKKDKTFINSILCGKNTFFSLDHIEKICKALDYSVYKLFMEKEDILIEKKKTPTQQVLMETTDMLSDEEQKKVLRFALERQEIQQRGLGKKAIAPQEKGGGGGLVGQVT